MFVSKPAHNWHTPNHKLSLFMRSFHASGLMGRESECSFSESERPRNPAHISHTEFEIDVVPTSELPTTRQEPGFQYSAPSGQPNKCCLTAMHHTLLVWLGAKKRNVI